MWTDDDLKFMREAHDLARSAEGRTTPDPLVGVVMVKGGRIISMGYHGEVATPHAEAWAIQKAGEKVKGSTLYINLEPCCHYGNNPPCVDLIASSGIREVIASMKDPNPLVNGKGFKKLRAYGVKVRTGLMQKEAEELNEAFVEYITTKKPFVVLKSAITIDGKIATRTGASRWVAGKASRRFAHHLRNIYDAILAGVQTVLIDNPRLTVREVKKVKNPIRIVLDAYARTPLGANVLSKEARTIIVVGPGAKKSRLEALKGGGAEILKLPAPQGRIDVRALVRALGKMKITSLLLEGGGEVNASFLEAGLVDKAHFIIAPKIFGGREARTAVEGKGVNLPSQAKWLKNVQIEQSGEDILVTGYLG